MEPHDERMKQKQRFFRRVFKPRRQPKVTCSRWACFPLICNIISQWYEPKALRVPLFQFLKTFFSFFKKNKKKIYLSALSTLEETSSEQENCRAETMTILIPFSIPLYCCGVACQVNIMNISKHYKWHTWLWQRYLKLWILLQMENTPKIQELDTFWIAFGWVQGLLGCREFWHLPTAVDLNLMEAPPGGPTLVLRKFLMALGEFGSIISELVQAQRIHVMLIQHSYQYLILHRYF